jgi:hypothetical protein
MLQLTWLQAQLLQLGFLLLSQTILEKRGPLFQFEALWAL